MKKSMLKRVLNRSFHTLARFLPGLNSVRPALHKLRGVRISGKVSEVSIGEDVYLENEYPECVEIHSPAYIGLRSTIITHFREGRGKLILCKYARIGACSTVIVNPAKKLIIGEGSVISAGSLVTRNVPPYTLVAGVPATPIAKITVPSTRDKTWKEFREGLLPIRSKR